MGQVQWLLRNTKARKDSHPGTTKYTLTTSWLSSSDHEHKTWKKTDSTKWSSGNESQILGDRFNHAKLPRTIVVFVRSDPEGLKDEPSEKRWCGWENHRKKNLQRENLRRNIYGEKSPPPPHPNRYLSGPSLRLATRRVIHFKQFHKNSDICDIRFIIYIIISLLDCMKNFLIFKYFCHVLLYLFRVLVFLA